MKKFETRIDDRPSRRLRETSKVFALARGCGKMGMEGDRDHGAEDTKQVYHPVLR